MEGEDVPDKMRRRGGGAIVHYQKRKEAEEVGSSEASPLDERNAQRRDCRCLLKDEGSPIKKRGQSDSNRGN